MVHRRGIFQTVILYLIYLASRLWMMSISPLKTAILLIIANMVLLSVAQQQPWTKSIIPISGRMDWDAEAITKTAEGFLGFRWNSKALD